MTNFSIFTCFLLSLFLHVVFLGVLYSTEHQAPYTEWNLQPEYGRRISVSLALPQGRGQQQNSPKTPNQKGDTEIRKEIAKILRNLQYPPLAKERGWESDCEWVVKVEQNGKLDIVEETKKCKYRIFSMYFQAALENWKSELPTGIVLKIPVRFSLEKYGN